MYVRIAATAAAAAALLAGCGGSGGGGAPSTAAPPATTTAPATTTTTTGVPTTTVAPASRRIALDVSGGKINGDGRARVTVAQGTKVVLQVTADVSDEVHVHGYDLQGEVAPGKPATIRFEADVPGRFEAELESRGMPILQLQVNP